MKKFLGLFIAAAIFFISFLPAVDAAQKRDGNKKWSNPKLIRTYIPPNHNRTVMMKHAFAEWTRLTNNKVIFRYVTARDTADIKVFFVPVIPNADREIGLTVFHSSTFDKLLDAEVYIADKTSDGRKLGNDAVYTVMLHEIGHAIGIANHSTNPKSIMYPEEDDIQEILQSDLKTLAEIYNW